MVDPLSIAPAMGAPDFPTPKGAPRIPQRPFDHRLGRVY